MAQLVDHGWTYSYCLGLHFSFFINFFFDSWIIFSFLLICLVFFFVQTTVSQSTLFDHLINIWEFSPGPVPGTCNLYFLVDFKFQSPLYSQVWFCYHLFISTCFFGVFMLCIGNQSLFSLYLHFLFSNSEPCTPFIFCVLCMLMKCQSNIAL